LALIAPPCHSFEADTLIDGHLILGERGPRSMSATRHLPLRKDRNVRPARLAERGHKSQIKFSQVLAGMRICGTAGNCSYKFRAAARRIRAVFDGTWVCCREEAVTAAGLLTRLDGTREHG